MSVIGKASKAFAVAQILSQQSPFGEAGSLVVSEVFIDNGYLLQGDALFFGVPADF